MPSIAPSQVLSAAPLRPYFACTEIVLRCSLIPTSPQPRFVRRLQKGHRIDLEKLNCSSEQRAVLFHFTHLLDWLVFSEGRRLLFSPVSHPRLYTAHSFHMFSLIWAPWFTFFIPIPSCVCRRKSNVWSSVKYPGVGWLQTDEEAINSIYRKENGGLETWFRG